uniref:Uncharacterized protein n=1 Tax=Cucumis melo TaxID=3656 RepID=A0A9I9D5D6_CUCME
MEREGSHMTKRKRESERLVATIDSGLFSVCRPTFSGEERAVVFCGGWVMFSGEETEFSGIGYRRILCNVCSGFHGQSRRALT